MLENATRLCGAKFGVLFVAEGGTAFRMVAAHGVPPAFLEARRREPVVATNPDTVIGRVAATKRPFQLPDVQAEAAYATDPARSAFIKLTGARTVLNVPMLKDGTILGQIAIYRQEVRPFTDKEIALLTNFAAQAVIAIENTRLLNELRQRTDDLTESLEQQTATSEVLSVISSSPGELDPVFKTILENATRICDAKFGHLFRYEAGAFRAVAMHNTPAAFDEFLQGGPVQPAPGTGLARIADDSRPIAHPGCQRAATGLPPSAIRSSSPAPNSGCAQRCLIVPMLKDAALIGVDRHLPPGGSPVHRQADRAGDEFRRPGRHRHREHAAAQRIAPAHRRSHRVAGAADGDLGGVARHQLVARRTAAGISSHAGKCHAAVSRKIWRSVPDDADETS